MRLRLKLDADCEHTIWGLAAHLEDAAFFVVFGILVGGVLLLMSYTR